MSSESFAESAGGVLAAWETQGQVYYTQIDPTTGKRSQPIPAPGAAKDRKHPSVSANGVGEVILAWTERSGWEKAGSLVWQVFDPAGHPTGELGRVEGGIPVWSMAAVVPRPDGGFTVIHCAEPDARRDLVVMWISPATGEVLGTEWVPAGQRTLGVPPFTIDVALKISPAGGPR